MLNASRDKKMAQAPQEVGHFEKNTRISKKENQQKGPVCRLISVQRDRKKYAAKKFLFVAGFSCLFCFFLSF